MIITPSLALIICFHILLLNVVGWWVWLNNRVARPAYAVSLICYGISQKKCVYCVSTSHVIQKCWEDVELSIEVLRILFEDPVDARKEKNDKKRKHVDLGPALQQQPRKPLATMASPFWGSENCGPLQARILCNSSVILCNPSLPC